RSILLLSLAAIPNLILRPLMLFLAVCGFYLADIGLSAWSMMSLFFLVLSSIAVGQFFLVQRRLRREFGNVQPVYETRKWLANSAPLLVPMAFTAFFLELNILIAGLFLPPDQLAIYNVAFRTAELMGFFLRAVNFQFSPRASRLYGQGDAAGFQRLVARAAQLRFWAIVVAFVALVLVGKFLLGIFGEQFVSGYTALIVLAGAKLIQGAFGPLIQVVTITGNHNRCLPVFAASIVLSLGSSAILIPQYGIEGGAFSVFVATLVSNVWIYRIVVKRVQVDPSVLSLRLAFR
nr:polysaccharide biosynthesis C-terminal domain-containing protein [Erythrobacter sp.]